MRGRSLRCLFFPIHCSSFGWFHCFLVTSGSQKGIQVSDESVGLSLACQREACASTGWREVSVGYVTLRGIIASEMNATSFSYRKIILRTFQKTRNCRLQALLGFHGGSRVWRGRQGLSVLRKLTPFQLWETFKRLWKSDKMRFIVEKD